MTSPYSSQQNYTAKLNEIKSPRKFERSPTLKFARKLHIHQQTEYDHHTVQNIDSPKPSFKESNLGSFRSNPQDMGKRFLRSSKSAKNLIDFNDYKMIKKKKQNGNTNQLIKHYQSPNFRKSEYFQTNTDSNTLAQLKKLKMQNEEQSRLLKQTQQTAKKNQIDIEKKYNVLQRQYKRVLYNIKVLEQMNAAKQLEMQRMNIEISSVLQQQLIKHDNLQTHYRVLHEQLRKLNEACKSHSIEISMLNKQKKEAVQMEIKTHRMMEKNKQLEKQLQQLANKRKTNNSGLRMVKSEGKRKRKDSLDLLFDFAYECKGSNN